MTRPHHQRVAARRTWPVAVALVVALVVALYAWLEPRGEPHRRASVAPSSTTTSSTIAAPVRALERDVAALLAHRDGTVAMAVENLNTDLTATWGSPAPQAEASVVKVAILGTLLATSTTTNEPLTPRVRALAAQMIELSNNDAATALWRAAGGAAGLATFDHRIGLTSTSPSTCLVCAGFGWPGWGLTTTTPLDELRVLRAVLFSPRYVNAPGRTLARSLMTSVVPSERWGVANGVPGDASVALKNGWLPLDGADSDWQINSVGWVHGDGRNYLAAIFSTANPSETYGIDTLNAISHVLWRDLA